MNIIQRHLLGSKKQKKNTVKKKNMRSQSLSVRVGPSKIISAGNGGAEVVSYLITNCVLDRFLNSKVKKFLSWCGKILHVDQKKNNQNNSEKKPILFSVVVFMRN